MDTIIQKTKEWLGEEGISHFQQYKEKYDTVSPVFYDEKALIPHPVHFREGMQIRNFLRQLPECKEWTAHDFDNRWIEIIEKAIS